MKVILKKFDIDPRVLESSAVDRNVWRSQCYDGANIYERKRNERMRLRRELRHRRMGQDVAPPDGGYPCTYCGRVCLSRIGLRSHEGAHQRKATRRGADVIEPNDPP